MTSASAVSAANALIDAGRLEEAEAAWRKIVEDNPEDFAALHLLAYVVATRGRVEESLPMLDRAVAGAPGNPAMVASRGHVLRALGRLAEAARDFEAALKSEPRNVPALNDFADVLRGLGRDAESRECIDRALAVDPGNPVALNNLGRLLHKAGHLDEAIERYASADARLPGSAALLTNWANALHDRGDLGGAYRRYEDALHASPGMPAALYGRAHVDLREGRFARGWDGYEARFDTELFMRHRRAPSLPRLTLGNLSGAKRVAIWSEQGLGDQLLQSTLLGELERHGLTAVVEVDARLLLACRRALPSMAFVPIGTMGAFAGCDHQIPIASLAGLFRRSGEDFQSQPQAFLSADPARAKAIAGRLGPGRWIAVCWRSPQVGDRQWLGARKSAPLECFAPLAEVADVGLVDLQYGDDANAERAAFEARHPGKLVRVEGLDTRDDLEGVLAALAACERAVVTSNSVAHLAGASGRPTSLLYLEARPPFHYWVPGPGGRSLWYPSVEIVTDGRWTKWEDAIASVRARL